VWSQPRSPLDGKRLAEISKVRGGPFRVGVTGAHDVLLKKLGILPLMGCQVASG
jgi:hypothetical protein